MVLYSTLKLQSGLCYSSNHRRQQRNRKPLITLQQIALLDRVLLTLKSVALASGKF
jgi:hypothetical protein